MTEKKPRANIDLKTVLVIMAFFGMGTWGSILLFAKRVMWHAVSDRTTEVIIKATVAERAITAASVITMRDSVIEYSEKRFDRIERLVERLPGGRKAIGDEDTEERRKRSRFNKIGYSGAENLQAKEQL